MAKTKSVLYISRHGEKMTGNQIRTISEKFFPGEEISYESGLVLLSPYIIWGRIGNGDANYVGIVLHMEDGTDYVVVDPGLIRYTFAYLHYQDVLEQEGKDSRDTFEAVMYFYKRRDSAPFFKKVEYDV